MTQETTNQIIVGVSSIVVAILPLIVKRLMNRISPSSPPLNLRAWFAIAAFVFSVVSLVFSVRSRPIPEDAIRSGDKISLGLHTSQGGPGYLGTLAPANFGQIQFRIDKTEGEFQKFTINKQR